MVDIRLAVLGPLRLMVGGAPVPVAGVKQRSLLAHLAAARGPVARDALVDAMWPDRRPADPAHALENHVSRLRGLVAPAANPVRHRGDGYELELEVVELDTVRFDGLVQQAGRAVEQQRDAEALELLEAAEELWRGRPFADLPDTPALAAEAGRLEQVRRAAHDLRFDAALLLGRHDDVVAELQQQVSEHPLDERRRGQLMVALAGAGRQAEALTVYDEGRRLLRDELGVDPGRELSDLHVRLLRGPLVAAPTPTPRSGLPAPLLVAARSPMVGRDRETAALRDRWDRASAGEGGLVLVEGEPGVGKTRLLADLGAHVLAVGGSVVLGRCDDGLQVPYQPFVEALGDLGGADTEDVSRHQLFDRVLHRLSTRSERAPLLLLIDDLHWATTPTLLLLRHLVRWGGDLSVLIVTAVRDRGYRTGPTEASLLAELGADEAAHRLRLDRLDVDAVRELIVAHGGHADAASVQARTSGNPFLVRELLRDLGALDGAPTPGTTPGVPERVDALVRGRRLRLSPEADRLLEAAAVVGPSFDVHTAGPAAELDEGTLPRALDELVAAGFLDRDDPPGHYAFAHALVRDAVLEDANPVRRRLLHRAVATTIEATVGSDQEGRVALLEEHFLEAGCWPEAVRYAGLAAEVATRRLAWEDAARHHRRALSVLDQAGEEHRRAELLLGLADAERRSGNTAEALDVYRRAYDEGRQRGSARQQADAAIGFEDARLEETFEDHATASRAMLAEAHEALSGSDDRLETALLARLAVADVHGAGRTDRAAELADTALARARTSGDRELLGAALEAAYWTDWTSAGLRRRLALSEELLALGPASRRTLRARVLRASACLEAADRDGWEQALSGYAAEAERVSEPWYQWWVRAFDGTRAILDGRLADLAAIVAELAPQAPARHPAEVVGIFATVLAYERGRRDALPLLVEGWSHVLRSGGGNPDHARAGLAFLTALQGETDRARDHLAQATVSSLAAWPSGTWGVALLGLAAAETGDHATCEEVAEALGHYPGRVVVMGAITPVTTTTFVLARVADALGDASRSLQLLAEATELHRALGAPTWTARSTFHRAELLGRAGRWQDVDAARRLADEAARSADRLGMDGLRRAAVELAEHLPAG